MTTPQAAARRRGADAELDFLKYARDTLHLPAERLRLAGRNDEGDVAINDIGLTYVCEVKNEKTINLSGYVTEALTEATNYATARRLERPNVMAVAIVKRRGRPVKDWYVVTTVGEFFTT